ncbi:Arc family DNA-binding protein [uncultured Shewanella sp.]|uniref:Arc family DNA-binding protein n=1 Tax=uncultured Shewanella sp. TaxID=173975 RepID=UPI0026357A0B|nr:Arc family DNA-binding protein [uncultured Shewanella sp.]
MSREHHQMRIRIPHELKSDLEEASKANKRSLNAEITSRLEFSLKHQAEDTYESKFSEKIDTILEETKKHHEILNKLQDSVIFGNYGSGKSSGYKDMKIKELKEK